MTTRVQIKFRRRTSCGPARPGSTLQGNASYPVFHDRTGNAGFIVLHSVDVDDGVLQVVGDCDNGHYEWVWFRLPELHSDTTSTVHYTRAGFGAPAYALCDGLKHALGEVAK